ncbi:MAG: DUF4249 domain-containing protein [Bacteroidia bacterium]|nr:DUF4249 domain-containing protein [Bacteroidia bacterium]
MKKFIPYITLLLLLTALSGCEKEIPFKEDVVRPKLVVNCLFSNDSTWQAHISHSTTVLDSNYFYPVTDAAVQVFDGSGNVVATLQSTNNGYYEAAGFTPAPSQTYRLEASAPGYESVSATDRTPGEVFITSIDTVSVQNQNGNTDLEVTITFTDPAGESNYYLIDVLRWQQFIFDVDTLNFSSFSSLACNDPNIETDNGFSLDGFNSNLYTTILLRDRNFDGQNYSLKFTIPYWSDMYLRNVSAIIGLTASSEAFFNYRRSLDAYNRVYGDPFAQPVQVYTNVSNGHGIFAGGTRTVWEMIF